MTYDCFMFFNELDLLEIRLNILDPYVDFFVIGESTETFSGKPKPLYYAENKDRFAKWNHKIIHHVIGNHEASTAFERAAFQKDSIRQALVGLKDEDIVYYGDLDEIWKPQVVGDEIYKLRQICYTYYLNNQSSEDWKGTNVCKYKNLPNLNDMRANHNHILNDGGWHFTNMGGPEAVLKKIEAYDHQEFNTPEIKAKIEKRMKANKDYVGRIFDYKWRRFKFWIDEKDLPQYLKDNKQKYIYLFK